jgi:NAD(P)-dependent dehydrogenase (short-subunit alcohol dehydrogenase family)
MLVSAWAKRLSQRNITINACHPGDVNSELSNNLGFGGSESPEQGAATPVWLATAEEISEISGKYFERLTEVYCPFGANADSCETLFNICRKFG